MAVLVLARDSAATPMRQWQLSRMRLLHAFASVPSTARSAGAVGLGAVAELDKTSGCLCCAVDIAKALHVSIQAECFRYQRLTFKALSAADMSAAHRLLAECC